MSYPQTSCPCSYCPPQNRYNYTAEPDCAKPNSLAVPDCIESFNLKYCTDKQVYKQDIQPKPVSNAKSIKLNKLGLKLQEQNYIPVKADLSNQCEVAYAGCNPLLIDAMRGDRLLLDRPNLTGKVPINVCPNQVYQPWLNTYGKNYTNYNDITGGQIQYYVDPTNADAYYPPNFVTPALIDHTIKVNPMGVVYPQYERQSMQPYMWDGCNKDECNSSTKDQLTFREGLMASQMRKMNQQRYQPRWAKNVLS